VLIGGPAVIRLNRMTDYAIVVLGQMSREGVVNVAQLAQESAAPQPAVAKLLKQLAQAGIVVSRRGAAGGYSLAREPEAITVAEIVTALEGPISLTACVDGADDACAVERLCPMRGNWNKVNQAIRRALADVTLADMAPAPMFRAPAAPSRPEVRHG
jgi:FeS assembly SUF system regulator